MGFGQEGTQRRGSSEVMFGPTSPEWVVLEKASLAASIAQTGNEMNNPSAQVVIGEVLRGM